MREAVAVAAEQEDVQIGPGEADAGGQRDGAAVDEVGAVAVDEIGKARGAADAGEGDDLLVIDLAFLENLVIGGEDGEVAAAGTPGGVIGGDGFLGEFLAGASMSGYSLIKSGDRKSIVSSAQFGSCKGVRVCSIVDWFGSLVRLRRAMAAFSARSGRCFE